MTDLISIKAADNIRLARSGTIITPAADTYNLIRLPKFSFVLDVILWCIAAGSSDTLDIGFIGNGEAADPDHFLDAAYALVLTGGIGYYRATKDTTSLFAGKWFSDARGMITMTIGTTQTVGQFIVFAEYIILH